MVTDQDTAPLADADEDDDNAEEPVDVDLSVVFNARIVKGDQSLLCAIDLITASSSSEQSSSHL